jgi:hypothetical protein
LDLGSGCCRKTRRKKIGGKEGRLTENLCILERRLRGYVGEMNKSSRSLKNEDIWMNAVTFEITSKQKGKDIRDL